MGIDNLYLPALRINPARLTRRTPGLDSRPRVMIATPCNHDFTASDFQTAMDALKVWEGVTKTRQDAPFLPEMRNLACRQALQKGVEALLMIDSDMIFPPHALERLTTHGKPIVSGNCLRRRRPFEPTTAIAGDDGRLSVIRLQGRGLVPVEAVGAAFLYIETDVLNKIQDPWFERTDRLGEDYDFCEKARKAGFPIFVDLDLPIGHITQAVVWPGADGEPEIRMK